MSKGLSSALKKCDVEKNSSFFSLFSIYRFYLVDDDALMRSMEGVVG